MPWEIVLLEPVETWFLELCATDPATALLVELRPGSRGRTELRLLFVFDPERQAVVLVAGDKSGRWSRWHPEAMALAEQRYADYRDERKAEQARQAGTAEQEDRR